MYGVKYLKCKFCHQYRNQSIYNNPYINFCDSRCYNSYHTANTCKNCRIRIELGKTYCNNCSSQKTSKSTYNIPYHVPHKNRCIIPEPNCYLTIPNNIFIPRIVPPTTNYVYGNGPFNDMVQSSYGPVYFHNNDKF